MSLHWSSIQQSSSLPFTGYPQDPSPLIQSFRVPSTMIGQHKRSLEHALSSKPVKYQKHSDERLCEVNPRVTLLTDAKSEQRQNCTETQPSISTFPGDTLEAKSAVERSRSSELCNPAEDQDIVKLGNVKSVESVACRVSQECALSSEEYEAPGAAHEGAVRKVKDIPYEDSGVKTRKTSVGDRDKGGNEDLRTVAVQFGSTAGNDKLPLSEADTLHTGKVWNSRVISGIDPSHLSSRLQVDCRTGLPHGAQAGKQSSIDIKVKEEDSFPVHVEKTNDAHLTNRHEAFSPVFISNQAIELTRVDEEVQRYGGYDRVTTEGLWGRISAELDLEYDCGPGLKLIYFKYLKAQKKHNGEHLFDSLIDSKQTSTHLWSKSSVDEKVDNHFLVDAEQFAESEPLHEKHGEIDSKGGGCPLRSFDQTEGDHSEGEIGRVTTKRGAEQDNFHARHRVDAPLLGNCSLSKECQDIPMPVQSDCRQPKGHGIDDLAALAAREVLTKNVQADASILERERRTLADMLKWIKRVALEPGNVKMGTGFEGTGENEAWATACASLAWKFRSLLWKRKEDNKLADVSAHQVRQVPAPSQYYEASPRPEQQGLERLRATRERVAHYGFSISQKPLHDSLSLHKGSSSSHNQPRDTLNVHHMPRQGHFSNEDQYFDELNDRPRKRVPIGPDFQVCLPSAKLLGRSSSTADSFRAGGKAYCSDEDDSDEKEDERRWLGKRVWPPLLSKRFGGRSNLGRNRFCSCSDPESIDCVRLHVLEGRERLSYELGEAFYIWKFDEMGEAGTKHWTRDEERSFKELVKMNPPSQDKNFWDLLPEAFPEKTWSDFVSYYFNVFVLRRRAVQNRLDSKHVDSDDDETELPEGLISEDSEEYESEDEVDDEPYEDDSDETYVDVGKVDEIMGGATCGDDASSKLLEDHRFCGVGVSVHSSKMDVHGDSQAGVPASFRLYYSDREYLNHDVVKDRNTGLLKAHAATTWSHEEQDDEEKHLNDHVSSVGEYELQEVKTWEAAHWDETDLDDQAHVPPAKGMNFKGENLLVTVTTAPDSSPDRKATVAHHSIAANSCEREVWDTSTDITTTKEKDKLLSTNGMIQEFFGNEV